MDLETKRELRSIKKKKAAIKAARWKEFRTMKSQPSLYSSAFDLISFRKNRDDSSPLMSRPLPKELNITMCPPAHW